MHTVCPRHVPSDGLGVFATALTVHGMSLERHLVPQDGLPKDLGNLLNVMAQSISLNHLDPLACSPACHLVPIGIQ